MGVNFAFSRLAVALGAAECATTQTVHLAASVPSSDDAQQKQMLTRTSATSTTPPRYFTIDRTLLTPQKALSEIYTERKT